MLVLPPRVVPLIGGNSYSDGNEETDFVNRLSLLVKAKIKIKIGLLLSNTK